MEQSHYQTGEIFDMPQITIGEPINVGRGAIAAKETSDAQTVGERLVNEFMVKVEDGTPSCCIDGRCGVCLLNGEPVNEARPSTAGGGVATSFAGAKLTGWDAKQTNEELLRSVNGILEASNLPSGAHCDTSAYEKAFGDGKTGCGAVDRMDEILHNLGKYGKSTAFIGMMKDLVAPLGVTFEVTSHETTVHNAQLSSANDELKDWSGRDLLDTVGSEERIEVLQASEEGVGGHFEDFVVFNYRKGYTIDRDAYFAATGRQVFVVDMWYIDELARALETPVASYEDLLQAMTSYQIATYITLCDGSQRPIILT